MKFTKQYVFPVLQKASIKSHLSPGEYLCTVPLPALEGSGPVEISQRAQHQQRLERRAGGGAGGHGPLETAPVGAGHGGATGDDDDVGLASHGNATASHPACHSFVAKPGSGLWSQQPWPAQEP